MKNILLALGALIIIAGGIFYVVRLQSLTPTTYVKPTATSTNAIPPVTTEVETPVATSTSQVSTTEVKEGESVIGTSVSGADIVAYHFGTGDRELLLIGGIHGGYSWNTTLLGYEMVDWLEKNPTVIPAGVRVTVIPNLNPDGLTTLTGTTGRFTTLQVSGKSDAEKIAARFNANQVDLNRNFDCDWKASGTWQTRTVSGGTAAFSEPESRAVRDYIKKNEPNAVIAWYSAAGGVYASFCDGKPLPATLALMNNFAKASSYPAYEEYDYYEITGDMVNWLAREQIPAISVLLTSHTATDLAKNQAGVTSVLRNLAQ